ncbi:50S ribosomal protein L25 [candidate division KSB1 bacterium]|nr:50S ribosomal protein L25 [candidate division KSB1 bacterium]
MSENTIVAKIRKMTGKEHSKVLRREGKIPGIFYIHGEESVPLTLEAKQVSITIASKPALISLELDDGSKKEAVIRQVQRDPVTTTITHVDFMGITRGVKITVFVPMLLSGVPVGTKIGGILEHLTREIEIECLPKNLPDKLEVDVSELDLGDSIHIKDLSFDNINIVTPDEVSIASVSLPKIHVEEVEEEEEELEEAAEAAEGDSPEVKKAEGQQETDKETPGGESHP